MDLLERMKDKMDPVKFAELQDWYKWCDTTSTRYAKEIKGKLAFELGHIPEPLQEAIRASISSAMREAGRHIVKTKLCDAVATDPVPSTEEETKP